MSNTDFTAEIARMANDAKTAARQLYSMPGAQKSRCLEALASELETSQAEILKANEKDIEAARENGLNAAMLDRLELTEKRLEKMTKGIRTLVGLQEPLGRVDATWLRPNGLKIRRVRVPIGVIGIIYESRPNVTADAAGLCIKAGNSVFLRGGSESIHSNKAIVDAMKRGCVREGLSESAIQLMPWTDREAVNQLLKMDNMIDLVIPRGGEGLIRTVVENSTIPVIKHYKGVCHVYVHADADRDMAAQIVENAKCQRPGVCNAAETVLIHRDIADDFAPRMATMLQEKGVALKGDKEFCDLVPDAERAANEDWQTEYLDLVLNVGIVGSVQEAVEHITQYGSEHSDSIVTSDKKTANYFTRNVDSAAVYVNASTRFTDGGEFGMGAEIGVSTDHIHARGPMGIEELTTYKYVVNGQGQLRE